MGALFALLYLSGVGVSCLTVIASVNSYGVLIKNLAFVISCILIILIGVLHYYLSVPKLNKEDNRRIEPLGSIALGIYFLPLLLYAKMDYFISIPIIIITSIIIAFDYYVRGPKEKLNMAVMFIIFMLAGFFNIYYAFGNLYETLVMLKLESFSTLSFYIIIEILFSISIGCITQKMYQETQKMEVL